MNSELMVYSSSTKYNSSSLMPWFRERWTYLVDCLTRSPEPKVWQKQNTSGDVSYYAYDPHSGRSTYFTTEMDVRIWLEQVAYR